MRIGLVYIQSILSLICGIVVMASMFMDWWTMGFTMGGFNFVSSVSGWGVIGGDLPWVGPSGPIMVVIGGCLMIICALSSFALQHKFFDSLESEAIFDFLGKGARAVPLLAIFGAMFYLFDARDAGCGGFLPTEWIGAGPWVVIPLAIIGVGAGITRPAAMSETRAKKRAETLEHIGRSVAAGRGIKRDLFEQRLEEKQRPLHVAGDPDLAKNHFDRASDYESRGQDDQAITAYGDAIRVDPNYALAYFYRGSLFVLKANTDAALADFQKVVDLSNDPDLVAMAQKRIEKMEGSDL